MPQMRTEIFTYQTVPDGRTKLLYNAPGLIRIHLQLINAGPVAIGQRDDVAPVLSGKGLLLSPGNGEVFSTVLSKDNRIWIAAESVNQVKVTIEPVPYLEQILDSIETGFKGLSGIFGRLTRKGRA